MAGRVKSNFSFKIASLVLLNICLFIIYLIGIKGEVKDNNIGKQKLSGRENFRELESFFTKLANEKGAIHAYEELKEAKLAPGTDLHLLGHIVGEEIYVQEGITAIVYCTPDLQYACSHAIISRYLLENGEGNINKIKGICDSLLEGSGGAYLQCFHGLGHGALAYVNYDLPKAIDLCQMAGAQGETRSCIGGVVMELVGGGLHNKKVWAQQHDKYFSSADPLAPCNKLFMPENSKSICYIFSTPYLLSYYNPQNITNGDNIKKAFELCSLIPSTEKENKTACYGGFGKEFAVLAMDRQIKSGYIATNEELTKAYNWCILAPERDGVLACIAYAVDAYYSNGDNPYTNAVNFCSLNESKYRDHCFKIIVNLVLKFNIDKKNIETFCSEIPEQFMYLCVE